MRECIDFYLNHKIKGLHIFHVHKSKRSLRTVYITVYCQWSVRCLPSITLVSFFFPAEKAILSLITSQRRKSQQILCSKNLLRPPNLEKYHSVFGRSFKHQHLGDLLFPAHYHYHITVSLFSSSSKAILKLQQNMSAKLISGTETSKQIQAELKEEVARLREEKSDFAPGLAIVQVGGREDSNVYIRMKIKAATEIGIKAQHIKFPKTITETELLDELKKLNNDDTVHGIIVQMPLDTDNPIDSHKVTDAVDPSKDVDGLCTINEGRVAIGDLKSGFMPCTPYGCLELIKRTGVEIDGAKAVVLGRSKIVGTPIAELLKWHNATVTVCHSRTKNLEDEVRAAEILVVGIGRAEMVKGSWVKPGAVVIDCGINAIPDATKKSGSRLVGDVDFKEVSQVAGYITPVPGGVGPMTVCMLMKNTVISAAKALKR